MHIRGSAARLPTQDLSAGDPVQFPSTLSKGWRG